MWTKVFLTLGDKFSIWKQVSGFVDWRFTEQGADRFHNFIAFTMKHLQMLAVIFSFDFLPNPHLNLVNTDFIITVYIFLSCLSSLWEQPCTHTLLIVLQKSHNSEKQISLYSPKLISGLEHRKSSGLLPFLKRQLRQWSPGRHV